MPLVLKYHYGMRIVCEWHQGTIKPLLFEWDKQGMHVLDLAAVGQGGPHAETNDRAKLHGLAFFIDELEILDRLALQAARVFWGA